MLFGEKLKELRETNGLTQEKVAEHIGVTPRSYQYYESCRVYPTKTETYRKLTKLFGVKANSLLSEEDQHLIDAYAKDGPRALKDVKQLIEEVGDLYAGGKLSIVDREKIIIAVVEQYWEVRQRNRDKFTPKKYRKTPVVNLLTRYEA